MPATLGGYELVSRLGMGGMAEVFLARKPGPAGFEKRVAIKRILPHLSGQADFVGMFLEEARLAARLDHPHIVHIHDFGHDGDTYYLAMEHVAGEDLQAIIRRGREADAPIAPMDAATILIAACEALHHAHEQGIVHRDVTPSNLMVSYDGVVKLADFGIAKAEASATTTRAGAGTGSLKGKVAYMSPEQAGGHALDRRTDVYSLGICAWELLTGRRLYFHDHELHLLRLVQEAEAPQPSSRRRGLPRALEAVVMRALERDPAARFQTARELGEALAAWLTTTGKVATPGRLGSYMTRLFGADAAARARGTAPSMMQPLERTEAAPGANVAALAPSPMALHLHLPPLKLPRMRLLLPMLAILLSLFGMLLALHAPAAAKQGMMSGLQGGRP